MICKTAFDICNPDKGPVPSQLQFLRHQPVLRVGSIILAEGAIGCVASRLDLSRQNVTNLIAAMDSLCFCLFRSSDRSGLDHPQESVLDGIIDTQSPEGNASGLAIIERPRQQE